MTIDSNSPPPLGTEYYYPALDALQNMPHLSEQEEAQLLLLEILDGCPNYVYDTVVSHIESNLGSVYTLGVNLYRREPLLSRLSKNFPVPPPHDVIVPLETNEEGAEDGHQQLGSTIVVPQWDFKEVATDFLLCPVIFGNTNYLVNKTVPFGKHHGPTDGSDQELLDSYWYCKTYDEWISDPETKFLFPIEMYVDKTGKTAGLQSYCGEPMTWSTSLLNQSIRQSDEAWRVMGYIPDLEVSSSTKKKKANGANMTKGRSL
jgi:hypothetical protein